MKLTKRWKRMSELYRRFGKDFEHCCDFSYKSALEMFSHESTGTPVHHMNGFLIGKQWLNITVSMWREGLNSGNLITEELEEDFPNWWLRSVFANKTR